MGLVAKSGGLACGICKCIATSVVSAMIQAVQNLVAVTVVALTIPGIRPREFS